MAAGTPGVTVGPHDAKMGQAGAWTAEVVFDDVELAAALAVLPGAGAADVLVIAVDEQGGGACHTGARTCFHRELSAKVGGERRAGGGGEDDGDV